MIRKIICPTDLSHTAQNAVAYAAKLCQLTGASLELLNVQPVYAHQLLLSGEKKAEEIHKMSVALNEVCVEINKMFNISCAQEVVTEDLSLDEAVSKEAGFESLIVAGTNGADNLFQRVFGSNAFNIARQANANVLIIPEGVSYSTIQKMAFAWDYDIKKPAIRQLKQLADDLGSKLVFLHISTHLTEISKDVFNALSERITEVFGQAEDIDYRRMYSSDIRKGLDGFMKEKNADVLVISLKNGRLIRKAFRNETGIGSLPSYPLLIMHSKRLPGLFS